MARKFLILAREAGLSLEMNAINLEPFLAKDCFEVSSVAEFYQKLSDFDDHLTAIAKTASEKGQVLRFIGTLEKDVHFCL